MDERGCIEFLVDLVFLTNGLLDNAMYRQ